MKTVEQIKEMIEENMRDFKELDDKNSFAGGMAIGWIDALRWVLEDNEDDTTTN